LINYIQKRSKKSSALTVSPALVIFPIMDTIIRISCLKERKKEEKAIVNINHINKKRHMYSPLPNVFGSSRDRPLVHLNKLPGVSLQFQPISHEANHPNSREGSGEQNNVPEVDNDFSVVTNGCFHDVILGYKHMI
jgi:hypothetical protein